MYKGQGEKKSVKNLNIHSTKIINQSTLYVPMQDGTREGGIDLERLPPQNVGKTEDPCSVFIHC